LLIKYIMEFCIVPRDLNNIIIKLEIIKSVLEAYNAKLGFNEEPIN
jgi:hypothetical protein